MIRINFGKAPRHQGVCFLFGILAGIFSKLMLDLAYQPLPAIICGSIAITVGFILMNLQIEINPITSFSLIPLGLTIMVYGMNSWPFLSFAERLTESIIVVYYAGYFIYAFLHGIMFIGSMVEFLQE